MRDGSCASGHFALYCKKDDLQVVGIKKLKYEVSDHLSDSDQSRVLFPVR